MMKTLYAYLALILILFTVTACDTTGSTCVFPDQLLDTVTENVRVLPVGAACSDKCSQACSSIFTNPSINDDQINKCLPQCRTGVIFSTNFNRVVSTTPPNEYFERPQNLSTSTACSNSNSPSTRYSPDTNSIYNYLYPVQMTLAPDELISFTLNQDKVNELALCGVQSAWLIPNPYIWNNNVSYVTQCSQNGPLIKCVPALPTGLSLSTSRTSWNATNSLPTDSEINIRDGDFVSIDWYGKFIASPNAPNAIMNESLLISDPSASWYDVTQTSQMLQIPGCQLKINNGRILYDGRLEKAQTAAPVTFLGLKGTVGTKNFDRDTLSFLENMNACTINPTSPSCTPGGGVQPYGWKNFDGNITVDGFNHYTNYNFQITSNQQYTVDIISYTSPFSNNYHNAPFADFTTSVSTYYNVDVLPYSIRFEKNVRKYTFSGILHGFSSKFSRLAFLHPDFTPDSLCTGHQIPATAGYNYSAWVTNLGGHTVHASRAGCNYGNGQKLLYALTIPDSSGQYSLPHDPPIAGQGDSAYTTAWIEVNPNKTQFNMLDNQNPIGITIGYPDKFARSSSSGLPPPARIWFAIDTSITDFNIDLADNATNYTDASSIPGSINASDLTQIQHRYGEYNVFLNKTKMQKTFVNAISGPVNDIYSYLFGGKLSTGKNTPGIVPQIFNNYVINSDFSKAIRALLVLYVAITGLLFALGMSQLTQQEAVPRALKLAIILMLTSPNSWTFFYENFFAIFTNGVIEMISYLVGTIDLNASYSGEVYAISTSSIASTATSAIRYDIGNSFGIFDTLVAVFIAKPTWIRLLGLSLSTFTGFLLTISFLIAFCYAFVGIFRCVLIYLISLVGIGLLIMLAPVFMCFILFKSTKQIFDGWLKQLISFAIQPIITIPAIYLLGYLLMIATYSTLNFTACQICLVGIYIPSVDIFGFSTPKLDVCFIPYFTTLLAAFSTSGFASPLLQITPVVCLLVLGQATYAFSYLGPNLGQMIVASFGGLNLGYIASSANPLTRAASVGGKALGLDIKR